VTDVYLPPYTVTSDHANSTVFVEFMLRMILKAIGEAMLVSEKILRLIQAKETITIAEMAELTGAATRTIERTLKGLKEEGRLQRIGPAKGGRWRVAEKNF
jgi:predicted HTH transcriptional regulator